MKNKNTILEIVTQAIVIESKSIPRLIEFLTKYLENTVNFIQFLKVKFIIYSNSKYKVMVNKMHGVISDLDFIHLFKDNSDICNLNSVSTKNKNFKYNCV